VGCLQNNKWLLGLGHFERRKVAHSTCRRAFGTACIHKHACIRCPMLRPDPSQQRRLLEVRDNLRSRIEEAHLEGWLGEIEGLRVRLAPPSLVEPSEDLDRGDDERSEFVGRASVLGVDETDPAQARSDPARGVVAIGEVPPLEPPLRPQRYRLPGLPKDRLRGWVPPSCSPSSAA